MMKFSSVFIITAAMFLATACDPSLEDLVEDEELRRKILAECAKNIKDSVQEEDQNCLNAAKAQMVVIQTGGFLK